MNLSDLCEPWAGDVSLDGGRAILLLGPALVRLRGVPDETVQCCVTSPPYWGLREYTGDPGMIGLEATIDEHLANLVAVFREVRRVLRKDGTLWLNYGDAYVGANNKSSGKMYEKFSARGSDAKYNSLKWKANGLPNKNLLGMPWRVAFALQADGWVLRNDIIWYKPNCMPESCRDRCTRAHDYVFHFTKSAKYYYDHEAVKEPATGSAHSRGHGANSKCAPQRGRNRQNVSFSKAVNTTVKTRNRRTVWTIPTKGYSAAHFATYPPALVEPCIKAGSAPGDIVLDPFSGAATTGLVALNLGRRYIGCEISEEYLELSRKRLEDATLERMLG